MAEFGESLAVAYQERAGSEDRFYLKVKNSEEMPVISTSKNSVGGWIKKVFLPQGFPDTVSFDYMPYQIWDTAQAFCSTISGTMATQEVLRGLGVGTATATPLAATAIWVFKDGCGHVSRILFAFTHGKQLDAYSKKWRLYADTLNNVAMFTEIVLPRFGGYSWIVLCVSTIIKSIVGVAGGATRLAMTQHHALAGNLADVSAKDSAQETAVNLVASMFALLIITCFGCSLPIFMLMMVLHMFCNYNAVRAVCLPTLNEPRFLLLLDNYIKQNVVAAPHAINKIEPIGFYHPGRCALDEKICGFKIKLGTSIQGAFSGTRLKATKLMELQDAYRYKSYILVANINTRTIHVLIKLGASAEAVLCGYCHAVLLAISTCVINNQTTPVSGIDGSLPIMKMCTTLQEASWSRKEAPAPAPADDLHFAYSPSLEMHLHLNEIMANDWIGLRNDLRIIVFEPSMKAKTQSKD